MSTASVPGRFRAALFRGPRLSHGDARGVHRGAGRVSRTNCLLRCCNRLVQRGAGDPGGVIAAEAPRAPTAEAIPRTRHHREIRVLE